MKERRREQKLKRKNFLPTLLVTLLLWVLMGVIIYFVDPNVFGAIPTFFIFLFLTLLFTFSLFLGNRRRGFLTATSLTFFSLLSYLGVGNIINFILIVAIAICIELYWARF